MKGFLLGDFFRFKKGASNSQLASFNRKEIKKMDCIFCAIVAGEIPAAKVYEDEHAFAFMDIAPQTQGIPS